MKKIFLALTAMIAISTSAHAGGPEMSWEVGAIKGYADNRATITAIKNFKQRKKDFVVLYVHDKYLVDYIGLYLDESELDEMITYLQQAKELLK
jgi:hypothetical protein